MIAMEGLLLVVLASGESLMRITTPETCWEIAGAVGDGKGVVATLEDRSEFVTRAACYVMELPDAECEEPTSD